MSLFQCDKCGVTENTATADFGYLAHLLNRESLVVRGLDPEGKYCSECYTGKWHERFPKEYNPIGTMETGPDGNLREKNK